MTDVVVEAPACPFKAVLEIQHGEGPWPGVVVVHDALGMNADSKRIARRIADKGYLAIVPALYSRGGRTLCITRVYRELLNHEGRAFDDLLAARDHLGSRDDCTNAVAAAGFCLGGEFALVLAPKGFSASAAFYPSIPPSHYNDILDGACPVIASLGARDPVLRGAGPRLERKLESKGIEHDVKTYDGVGHSFANEIFGQPLLRISGFGYNEEAAEDAWARVFAFFETHMRTT